MKKKQKVSFLPKFHFTEFLTIWKSTWNRPHHHQTLSDFFLPLKEEEFFFFPQLILSSHFFAKMDFALQTNQLKSHSKYPLTWTAILVVDCMMQAFYNTAKEGVAHLLKCPDFNNLSSFTCNFHLALQRIWGSYQQYIHGECFLQPSLQFSSVLQIAQDD